MNQEDTFNRLVRVTYEELKSIVGGMSIKEFEKVSVDEESQRNFLRSFGWTTEDLKAELERHGML